MAHSPAPHRPTWLLAAAAIAALLAAAAASLTLWQDDAPRYRTEPVRRGDIEKSIAALGSLQPKEYVDVGAQVSGQLKRVHVEVGQAVQQGALLAEIDPTLYAAQVAADEASLRNLQAQLKQQEAELRLARQTHERNRGLFRERAVSQELLEGSEAALEVAAARKAALEAQIQQAQSTLQSDQANLEYTRIYAPMSGTVVSQSAVAGQTLNNRQTAPIILRIANLGTMTAEAQVTEADIVRIGVGMPVYFTTLGLPERRWQGRVRQVMPTPETVNDVVLYKVLVDVDNADGALMTDMTAQMFFLQGRAENTLLAPAAALTPSGGGEDRYRARVLVDGEVQTREVRVGLASRTEMQVLEGLAEGELLVTGEIKPPAAASAGGTGLGGMPVPPRSGP